MAKRRKNNVLKKIVRIKPKNLRMQYTKENMELALEEVMAGKSIAHASKKFNIPESTIRAKKNHKYCNKKPGPAAVLTPEEETELVEWIFHCCNTGFPIRKMQLIDSVQEICKKLKKRNPFKNGKPGRSWFESFLKRHPEISRTVSENVCLNRAKVSEGSLRNWFSEVLEYFNNNNLLNIEPEQIFNADETGVPLNLKPTGVLASKGCKNVYNIVGNNNEKENISVLVTGNAAGDLAPTFIVFSGKSLPKNASGKAPPEFSFGCSENGWMTSETFYGYIANSFEPWLTLKKIKRPVILFIDGHKSHLTLHLSKFCSKHEIVLIALHPNATDIQPLDVSFFRTFKAKINKSICVNSESIGIKNYQFAPILKKTLDSMDSKKLLVSGFKTCGLYPFDVNAIDFTKVFHKNENAVSPDVNPSGTSDNNDIDSLKVIEKLLGNEKLQKFRSNEDATWKGLAKDESLFEMWYGLSHPNIDVTTNNHINREMDNRNDESLEAVEAESPAIVSEKILPSIIYNNDYV